MTGNPELLDGITCLVPSISVYLGNNEKLIATPIGSFKSPKISIPVLVVPGFSLQTLGILLFLELGLQSKSRCLVTLFSKGNINIWHRRIGHASDETLRKLGFHGDLFKENSTSYQEGHPTLANF